MNTESLSSKPVTLEALSSETFINFPHICFLPVDAVSLRVSIMGFWALLALLSYSNFSTFSRSCFIYFFNSYFSSSCLALGLIISPMVRLKILLAWIIFLSMRADRSIFLFLYLFYWRTGFLTGIPLFIDSVLANSLTSPCTFWSWITCCSLLFFFYGLLFYIVWVTVLFPPSSIFIMDAVYLFDFSYLTVSYSSWILFNNT